MPAALPGIHHLRCLALEAQINELRTMQYRRAPEWYPHVTAQIDAALDEWARLHRSAA